MMKRIADAYLSRRAIVATGLFCLAGMRAAIARDRIKIRDLWADGGQFSGIAERLTGQMVEMRGYMAPPLKPEVSFFVLTRIPLAVCPFCDTEASWPDDLVSVDVGKPMTPTAFNYLISVVGRLEIGGKTDAATGFVSRVRLVDAVFTPVLAGTP